MKRQSGRKPLQTISSSSSNRPTEAAASTKTSLNGDDHDHDHNDDENDKSIDTQGSSGTTRSSSSITTRRRKKKRRKVRDFILDDSDTACLSHPNVDASTNTNYGETSTGKKRDSQKEAEEETREQQHRRQTGLRGKKNPVTTTTNADESTTTATDHSRKRPQQPRVTRAAAALLPFTSRTKTPKITNVTLQIYHDNNSDGNNGTNGLPIDASTTLVPATSASKAVVTTSNSTTTKTPSRSATKQPGKQSSPFRTKATAVETRTVPLRSKIQTDNSAQITHEKQQSVSRSSSSLDKANLPPNTETKAPFSSSSTAASITTRETRSSKNQQRQKRPADQKLPLTTESIPANHPPPLENCIPVATTATEPNKATETETNVTSTLNHDGATSPPVNANDDDEASLPLDVPALENEENGRDQSRDHGDEKQTSAKEYQTTRRRITRTTANNDAPCRLPSMEQQAKVVQELPVRTKKKTLSKNKTSAAASSVASKELKQQSSSSSPGRDPVSPSKVAQELPTFKVQPKKKAPSKSKKSSSPVASKERKQECSSSPPGTDPPISPSIYKHNETIPSKTPRLKRSQTSKFQSNCRTSSHENPNDSNDANQEPAYGQGKENDNTDVLESRHGEEDFLSSIEPAGEPQQEDRKKKATTTTKPTTHSPRNQVKEEEVEEDKTPLLAPLIGSDFVDQYRRCIPDNKDILKKMLGSLGSIASVNRSTIFEDLPSPPQRPLSGLVVHVPSGGKHSNPVPNGGDDDDDLSDITCHYTFRKKRKSSKSIPEPPTTAAAAESFDPRRPDKESSSFQKDTVQDALPTITNSSAQDPPVDQISTKERNKEEKPSTKRETKDPIMDQSKTSRFANKPGSPPPPLSQSQQKTSQICVALEKTAEKRQSMNVLPGKCSVKHSGFSKKDPPEMIQRSSGRNMIHINNHKKPRTPQDPPDSIHVRQSVGEKTRMIIPQNRVDSSKTDMKSKEKTTKKDFQTPARQILRKIQTQEKPSKPKPKGNIPLSQTTVKALPVDCSPCVVDNFCSSAIGSRYTKTQKLETQKSSKVVVNHREVTTRTPPTACSTPPDPHPPTAGSTPPSPHDTECFPQGFSTASPPMATELQALPQWTTELSGCTNRTPIIKLCDGRVFRHAPLPPGWTIAISKTRNVPFYIHPNLGTTFYPPVLMPSADGSISSTYMYIHPPASVISHKDHVSTDKNASHASSLPKKIGELNTNKPSDSLRSEIGLLPSLPCTVPRTGPGSQPSSKKTASDSDPEEEIEIARCAKSDVGAFHGPEVLKKSLCINKEDQLSNDNNVLFTSTEMPAAWNDSDSPLPCASQDSNANTEHHLSDCDVENRMVGAKDRFLESAKSQSKENPADTEDNILNELHSASVHRQDDDSLDQQPISGGPAEEQVLPSRRSNRSAGTPTTAYLSSNASSSTHSDKSPKSSGKNLPSGNKQQQQRRDQRSPQSLSEIKDTVVTALFRSSRTSSPSSLRPKKLEILPSIHDADFGCTQQDKSQTFDHADREREKSPFHSSAPNSPPNTEGNMSYTGNDFAIEDETSRSNRGSAVCSILTFKSVLSLRVRRPAKPLCCLQDLSELALTSSTKRIRRKKKKKQKHITKKKQKRKYSPAIPRSILAW